MKILIIILSIISFSWAFPSDISNLEKHVDKAFQTFSPVGLAVAVVKDGKIIWKKTYGYADREKKIEMKSNNLFNIASLSKAFTSTLTAMLVDKGQLKWTDKVIDYFPDFKLSDPYIAQNMNIVDLYSHRSGLGTFVGDLLWYHSNHSNEEIRHRMENLPIENGFREKYGYQNNMVTIGGGIVEKITGESWEKNIQKRILEPIGMTGTRTSNDDLLDGDPVTMPYSNNKRIPRYDFEGGKPAASLYSSIDDLSKWIIFNLQNGVWNEDTLIAKKHLHFLRRNHAARTVSKHYKRWGRNFEGVGMGWFLSDYHGHFVLDHGGSMPGYISRIALLPDDNAGLIILNNEEDGFVASAVYFQILDYLIQRETADWTTEIDILKKTLQERTVKREKERAHSRVEGTKPALELSGYTGTFRDKWYGDARVSLNEGKLHLVFVPAAKTFYGDLEHWHYNTFKVEFKDPFLTFGLITFHFNSKGKVEHFTIDLPSYDFHFNNLDFYLIKEKN